MRSSSGSFKNHFPTRLYDMLENAEKEGYSHIVSWCSDGKSFRVHQPDAIIPVLSLHFRQTQYRSLLRQLQGYGFTRFISGKKKGLIFHPSFKRGARNLCMRMQRKPSKPKAKKPKSFMPYSIKSAPVFEREDLSSINKKIACLLSMKHNLQQMLNSSIFEEEKLHSQKIQPTLATSNFSVSFPTTTMSCMTTQSSSIPQVRSSMISDDVQFHSQCEPTPIRTSYPLNVACPSNDDNKILDDKSATPAIVCSSIKEDPLLDLALEVTDDTDEWLTNQLSDFESVCEDSLSEPTSSDYDSLGEDSLLDLALEESDKWISDEFVEVDETGVTPLIFEYNSLESLACYAFGCDVLWSLSQMEYNAENR